MDNQSKVRVAIIGLGMGSYHLSLLKKYPMVEIVALCDLREDLLQTTAKQNDIPRTFTDYNDVFADPGVDAVVIALPVYLHATVRSLKDRCPTCPSLSRTGQVVPYWKNWGS